MQEALFDLSPLDNQPKETKYEPLFNEVDERRLQYEQSFHTRDYCIRYILTAITLWDLRCWKKHKREYSKSDVIEHLLQWLKDREEGLWTYNCGHCLYCIEKLLKDYHMPIEEIAELVLINGNVTYHNEIGTWKDIVSE